MILVNFSVASPFFSEPDEIISSLGKLSSWRRTDINLVKSSDEYRSYLGFFQVDAAVASKVRREVTDAFSVSRHLVSVMCQVVC